MTKQSTVVDTIKSQQWFDSLMHGVNSGIRDGDYYEIHNNLRLLAKCQSESILKLESRIAALEKLDHSKQNSNHIVGFVPDDLRG